MSSRSGNGEGSLYQRADGRWAGSVYVQLTDGRRKRVHVYAATRRDAHDKLTAIIVKDRRGLRTPVTEWTVGAYLDHWLESVVKVKNRPRTYELYEQTVRTYLKPTIGQVKLRELTIDQTQRMLNKTIDDMGGITRTVHRIRGTLRSALSRAEREELIVRNTAKLVELPTYQRKRITPWTAEQTLEFLKAAQGHRWYGAYLMLLSYGMRRGEVLGLRWRDVDFDAATVRVEQQLQRVGKTLQTGTVKTEAGRRLLPMIEPVGYALLDLWNERYGTTNPAENAASDADDSMRDLVFLSSTGTPIDPKNFVRTFHEIREKAGLPRITVHHTRHTAATMLKNLGVPARDAQLILGHAHITTTQQLYQHGDIKGQTRALGSVGALLTGTAAVKTAVTEELSTGQSTEIDALTSGGPSGDRTHDTLLKSLMLTKVSNPATPVISHIMLCTRQHFLGWVAVRFAVKARISRTDRQRLNDSIVLARAARDVQTERLRLASFPFNLLPLPERGTRTYETPEDIHNEAAA